MNRRDKSPRYTGDESPKYARESPPYYLGCRYRGYQGTISEPDAKGTYTTYGAVGKASAEIHAEIAHAAHCRAGAGS